MILCFYIVFKILYVFCIQKTSHFTPAKCLILSMHTWLVAPILDNAVLAYQLGMV